jgi:hypothetical protein
MSRSVDGCQVGLNVQDPGLSQSLGTKRWFLVGANDHLGAFRG